MSDTPRADHAYCAMIDQARRTECLGWEAKVRAGQFGESELKAHKKCAELYGMHVAYAECEREIAELKRSLAETAFPNAEALARRFHEHYEANAPLHGYVTREETRGFDPKTKNGRLMVAVCEMILRELRGAK